LSQSLTFKTQMLVLKKSNGFAGISAFENPEFYDLTRQAQDKINWAPSQIMYGISSLVSNVFGLLAMTAVVASCQPWLLLVLAVCALPNIVVQFVRGHESWKQFGYENVDRRRMDYYTSVLTSKDTAKEVRMFGLGDFFAGRFSTIFHELRTKRLRLFLKQLTRSSFLSLLSILGTGAAYLYTVARALTGSISVGSFVLYVQALSNVEGSFRRFIYKLAGLYEGNLYASNLFKFLDLEEPLLRASTAATKSPPAKLHKGLEFRSVAFGYSEDKLILKDVSFLIEPGQTVALVGENGAGKTTLVKLLSRLYDPRAGAILVDGVDLRELDLQQWRSKIAVVFQDYCQYHMTAGENIGIGQVDLMNNMAKIVRAAESGGARPVVEKLASGYDTMLGCFLPGKDKGADLSGGEWQRIALSRAFMRSDLHRNGDGLSASEACQPKDPHTDRSLQSMAPLIYNSSISQAEVLILDEPTAALDVQSEHDIYKRFAELTRGKTTLLISHRFSTVKMADVILVLKDGLIIEQGSHRQLVTKKSGVYAGLYNLQAQRYS
jgi:ATP-binding cassette, subfamily B, bacterial